MISGSALSNGHQEVKTLRWRRRERKGRGGEGGERGKGVRVKNNCWPLAIFRAKLPNDSQGGWPFGPIKIVIWWPYKKRASTYLCTSADATDTESNSESQPQYRTRNRGL